MPQTDSSMASGTRNGPAVHPEGLCEWGELGDQSPLVERRSEKQCSRGKHLQHPEAA